MQLSDILSQTGGLQSIARELGIGEDEAASAASALAPAVLGGFKKQAESHPQGLSGFGGMLNQLGGGGLLDSVLAQSPTDTTSGNNVLGQIFGSKDVSRAVAQNAAAQTGLNPSMLKQMLPMLAMVAAFLGFGPAMLTLLLGTMLASAYGVVLMVRGRAHGLTRLPLGSFLGIAGLFTALFGDRIIWWYRGLFV